MNLRLLKPALKTNVHRVGILLPLRLSGSYDYIIDQELPRGSLVTAPLGSREYLAAVWQPAEGEVEEAKLKRATPISTNPRLPESLCDFIDWVARYTLTSPGDGAGHGATRAAGLRAGSRPPRLRARSMYIAPSDTRASARAGCRG